MERLQIGTLRHRGYRGGDRVEILTDYGTGTIDESAPASDRPLRLWDGIPEITGHLLDGHASGRHLDGIAPDGHLEGMHLDDKHLWPAALIRLASPPVYFGAIQLAVRSQDSAGNVGSASPVITRVANSAPRPATDFRAAAFDAGTGVMTFALSPSPDLST